MFLLSFKSCVFEKASINNTVFFHSCVQNQLKNKIQNTDKWKSEPQLYYWWNQVGVLALSGWGRSSQSSPAPPRMRWDSGHPLSPLRGLCSPVTEKLRKRLLWGGSSGRRKGWSWSTCRLVTSWRAAPVLWLQWEGVRALAWGKEVPL